ncbi:MAG: superoxide dismutase [Bacteroidota bacterium]
MVHELPKLPYELNALEPHISRLTMEFHYGKHHQAYINNLNTLIQGTPFENASLETIVREAEGGIFNNGAQVWNHSFYFTGLSPHGGGQPKAALAAAIDKSFGSFETFKEQFTKASATLFGSGWAWLVRKNDNSLEIIQESNAGNPLRKGLIPILTCDVWEHAYYLDRQNKRPDYIQAFWNMVNWEIIENRY